MFRTIATTIVACAAAVTLSAQTPAPAKAMSAAAAPKQTTVAKAATVRKDTPASLRKEAKISMKTARATALKEVPNGKVRKSELERENGKLIYSFQIKLAGKTGWEEVNVDAVTGAVVSHDHETAKSEKKEEAAEKKK
jgi:uncharacterized membrane protein YkoI